MQISTLLPVLALLATPIIAREPIDARRQLSRHSKHARSVDDVARHMDRREALAAENPKAGLRKVRKRGANGCRVKGSSFSASVSAAAASNATMQVTSSSAVAASSAVVSSSAAAEAPVVAASSAAAAAAAASSGAAASSAAAAPSDVDQHWVAPSSAAAAAAASSEAPASSAAAPAQSSAAAAPVSVPAAAGFTPGGIKAGASGVDTLSLFGSHISWFWNYGSTRDAPESSLHFVPTLWGNGQQGNQDSSRLWNFQNMNWNAQYVQGFYEPDCLPPMSSAIDPAVAAPLWVSTVAPWRAKGALLISPGMCKQADEDWLTPFKNAIGDSNMWDITSVHINKLDMDGARKVLDHYWNTYGKPMWVTEFACVDDQNGFTPSEDQGQINNYINNIVDLLEGDSRVAAYSMSEGMGLGNTWPPYKDGALTESGRTYLNAISKYH